MARESSFESTFVYPEMFSKESDMHISHNETYTNDEKVNQYILQNNPLTIVTLCDQFSIN